jgi:hypothetical protein
MKTRLLSIVLLSVSSILDAVLPEKMEKDVAIGITEKISEQLVDSGKFMVLDRTSVSQSLKEIEFQMSGLVSDAEIKKAGERLGAAYVVVARVSLIYSSSDGKTFTACGQASNKLGPNLQVGLLAYAGNEGYFKLNPNSTAFFDYFRVSRSDKP